MKKWNLWLTFMWTSSHRRLELINLYHWRRTTRHGKRGATGKRDKVSGGNLRWRKIWTLTGAGRSLKPRARVGVIKMITSRKDIWYEGDSLMQSVRCLVCACMSGGMCILVMKSECKV